MRRLTVVALLLVAAASSSQCSDGDTTAIGPSSGVAASASRFANTGGSAQSDDQGGTPAGETGPGSESSISRLALVLVTDRNSDGRPNRGDSITFAISTSQMWDRVTVVCSQNGTEVLRAERTADAFTPLALGSSAWQPGPADCKATLDQVNDTKVTTLASATFTAGA
jgi:hypothetical protein